MSDDEELDEESYMRGRNMAWRMMLAECVRNLGIDRPGWINVRDGLPNPSVDVLLYAEDGTMLVAGIDGLTGDWYYDDELGPARDEITHWMPLPSPPRDDERAGEQHQQHDQHAGEQERGL
jgi:hypothetical protein